MRSDMYEIIIERPRGGAGWSKPGREAHRVRLDPERSTRREAMNRHYRSKHLSENLAPLRRFLWGRVGHLWDRVRSEITARISPGNAVQRHVLDHVWQYVETETIVIGGRAYYLSRRGRKNGYSPVESLGRYKLYVCPRTGILRRPKLAPRPRRP